MALVGQPSDEVPEILAAGTSEISLVFVSMSYRHPSGADAEYLAWHSLDHRPEQHRLAEVQASLRLVSTPQCRAARAASEPHLDATDHVMTYFFTDRSGLLGFGELSTALREADRVPFVLPPVERGAYEVVSRQAAPRCKVGADVLPWWPARGAYLLVEDQTAPVTDLLDVAGVAGAWSTVAAKVDRSTATAAPGQAMTLCFLDDDPVVVAQRLAPLLRERWQHSGVRGLLAAPFHVIVPYEWDRYLP